MNVDELVNDFFFNCQFKRNLSKKTLKAYKIDMRQFVYHYESSTTEESFQIYDREIMRSYIRLLSDLYKPKTVKRKIAVLKSFFGYLEFDDKIEISPFRKLKLKINPDKTLPRTIKLYNIKILFEYLYSQKELLKNSRGRLFKEAIRDIAVSELLFVTGKSRKAAIEIRK